MPSLSLVHHFFSSQLLDLFSEIHKWDKLKYEIPQCASDIYQHRQDLEGLREETLLLIKTYNRCDTLTNMYTLAYNLLSLYSVPLLSSRNMMGQPNTFHNSPFRNISNFMYLNQILIYLLF